MVLYGTVTVSQLDFVMQVYTIHVALIENDKLRKYIKCLKEGGMNVWFQRGSLVIPKGGYQTSQIRTCD